MSSTKIFIVVILAFLYSCGNAPERPEPILDPAYSPVITTTSSTSTVPPSNVGLSPDVPHYICPDNCVGGGGAAAGNCPVCGVALVHNQAFHDQQPSPISQPSAGGVPVTPPPAATTSPVTPEPPQNAAGVWHYTCSAGCAGGSGSAVACASCGATLVHNTAYHN